MFEFWEIFNDDFFDTIERNLCVIQSQICNSFVSIEIANTLITYHIQAQVQLLKFLVFVIAERLQTFPSYPATPQVQYFYF